MRVRLHPLLLPFLLLLFLYGGLGWYLYLLLFVTLHEAGHCITALSFGARIRQILITPIGEQAVISGLSTLSYAKRQCVYWAGPAVSLLLGGFFFFLDPPWAKACAYTNWAIAGFNLLPFLPMDGGRILLASSAKRWGTLRSAAALIHCSKGFGIFLIGIGLVQVILFPFNCSLLIIGCYLIGSNRRAYLTITYRTYRSLLQESVHPLPIRMLYTGLSMRLGETVTYFNTEYHYVLCTFYEGHLYQKHQEEVMTALLSQGTEGRLWELP